MSLSNIKTQIEDMSKFNQIEVLKILVSNKVDVNENKYGVHVNLTELSPEIIGELEAFITHINKQEALLNSVEQEKEKYKSTYFSK